MTSGRAAERRAPVSVRALRAEDAEAWASLRRAALEAHPLAFGATAEGGCAALVAFALARIALEESVLLGAFLEERMVGIVGIRRERGPKERHKAYLWGMFVAPEARRRGAGTLLLEAAIEAARGWSGVDRVLLSVSSAAPGAEALYRRAGFRPWGREPEALRWQGASADEIHMTRGVEQDASLRTDRLPLSDNRRTQDDP